MFRIKSNVNKTENMLGMPFLRPYWVMSQDGEKSQTSQFSAVMDDLYKHLDKLILYCQTAKFVPHSGLDNVLWVTRNAKDPRVRRGSTRLNDFDKKTGPFTSCVKLKI